MRVLAMFLIVGLISASSAWVVAQTENPTHRPLDLPSRGRGDSEDDEDEPETITFYGADFEGQAFFWCLDRSCSMGWGGELQTLKAETTSAINQLSPRSEFGLVRFNHGYDVWNLMPVKANLGNKSGANAWVNSTTDDGGTCIAPAAIQAIQIANQSSKRNKQVLMLGDGVPTCSSPAATAADIKSANFQNLQINTLYISAASEGIPLFQQIANENSGSFTLVE